MLTKSVMAFLILCAVVSVPDAVSAKSDAKDVVWKLIKEGKFDAAMTRTKEYLARDPRDIDALMMQGNVILREYMDKNAVPSVSANSDESIYNTAIGFIEEPVAVVPRETAAKVASLWKKCLALDNSREDIHMGLCYLYSQALMKKELLDHLPKMKAAIPHAQNLYYNMGDYARMFAERERFNDCMDVYKVIIRLYPDVGGLYSDMAGMYFKEGRLDEARTSMERAMSRKGLDEMVYGNAVAIFGVLGDFDKAREASKRFSHEHKNNAWLVYDGLLQYYRGQEGWKKPLSDFVKGKNQDPDDVALAKFLLSRENKDDFPGYWKSLEYAKESHCLVLLHKRAMKKFPGNYEPLFKYGELMNHYKNYSESVKAFEAIRRGAFKLTEQKQEMVDFHYAWALQDTKRVQEADKLWKAVFKSDNFYTKSAAAYFPGKNAQDQGRKKEAMDYFKLVSEKASDSKYATLCWNRLNWLKKQ